MSKSNSWQEMMEYLRSVDNCAVYGAGFQCKDLNKTLDRLESMIGHHEPEVRRQSVYCMSLKGSLERLYKSHKEGKTREVNTFIENPFAPKKI
jgi:hypothetical protein